MPLVSVVIPAYNAGRTIVETLNSVLRQSYENLEIIVVDDGSTDGTCKLVRALAERDARIRVICQRKSGVALARNAGITAARGVYIAPLDADDLWHPKRVQLHVEALEAAGPDTAVAYSPFYLIDRDGKAFAKSVLYNYSGDVFERQLGQNLVGNGSGLTVRRSAAVEVGGYSSLLFEKGAQGCEDFLFQLELARRYQYVCVPHYLVGYRKYPGNMSSDLVQMRYSQLHMYAYLCSKYGLPKESVSKHASEILWSLVRVVLHSKGKRAAGMEILKWVRDLHQVTHIIECLTEFVLAKLGRLLRRFPEVGIAVASRVTAGVGGLFPLHGVIEHIAL
ncbi:glycosyltransferase involved in cell wall biosynthesis [Roseimicrobium gellanilyticum]|uniref:Glycosyltransferase involved in cell wall biosynthesis n=1 Tax=Roseimicrobium gellanilyticum TaxID=748857 RepID=A0A366HDQ2_9BACT|nr:glycosyltransferase family A protein [Roseimicrobium gellanilyticum]RBP40582.1 glycosyltransferase involved in cell wall biosynthesis [Roseimicrobium gellanilyticum]